MARKILSPISKGATPAPRPDGGRTHRESSQSTRGTRTGGGRRVASTPQKSLGAPLAKKTAGGSSGVNSGLLPQNLQQRLSGGGPSTYMGGGGPSIMGGGPSVAPAVTPPSEEDYLAGDGSYQSQFAALKGALERYIADSDLQRTNYNTDYTSSLRDLGYTEGQDGAPGSWNWNDQLTASGKAYQNQLNDFAGRGMLQSQGYADAATDLERMFNQQYQQTATNKTNFMTGLDRELANYKGENTASQQAARAEAIARRAAQYGL